MSEFVSRREQAQINADALSLHLGEYAGDVYLTARNLFGRMSVMEQTVLQLDPASQELEAGLDVDGDPRIWIGTAEKIVTPTIKLRWVERFGLSPDLYYRLPDEAFVAIALAHEIGHIVQEDPEFARFFSDDFDETIHEPDEDYAAYMQSDNEVNADYIAATIIGNAELGKAIGLMPPSEPPLAWRSWGEQHDVPHTIELRKHQP